MKIEHDYNLAKLNTFGISVNAKFFVEINNENDVRELFNAPEFKNNRKLFLGGGSNVLFTKDFNGIVVLNKLKGIEILAVPTKVGIPTEVGKDFVYVRAMAGEIWHNLVAFSVDHGWWGIENLSLIPGTVGAAPMQNIGAYGAELKNVLDNVETFDIETGKKKIFTKEECGLGYRESVFKGKLKDKYFISAVTVRLSKIPKPNLSYKILQEYLENLSAQAGNKIEVKSSRDISNAVVSIRKSKLPDPAYIPNAGSFFKNVFVNEADFKKLQTAYTNMPHFEEDGAIKIPAGWLIEQCGWKGKRIGNVGVHDRQALVLVNHGGATGQEIKDLAEQIIRSVFEKFGLKLIPEVNLI